MHCFLLLPKLCYILLDSLVALLKNSQSALILLDVVIRLTPIGFRFLRLVHAHSQEHGHGQQASDTPAGKRLLHVSLHRPVVEYYSPTLMPAVECIWSTLAS